MQTTASNPTMAIVIILLALWTLPWKGYALWLAARKGHKWWFIALLIINTLAILEILYIFVFSKRKCSGECCCDDYKEKTEENKPQTEIK